MLLESPRTLSASSSSRGGRPRGGGQSWQGHPWGPVQGAGQEEGAGVQGEACSESLDMCSHDVLFRNITDNEQWVSVSSWCFVTSASCWSHVRFTLSLECFTILLTSETDIRLRLWQSDIPRADRVPPSDWSLVTLLSSHWLLRFTLRPPLTWPSSAQSQSSLSSRAFLSWGLPLLGHGKCQSSGSWLVSRCSWRPLIGWSLESCEQGYKCGRRGIKVAIFILQTWAEVSVTGVAYSRSLLDRIEQNSRYGQGIVQVLCICCPPEFLLHGKKKGPFYDSHAICFSLKPLVLFQVNEVY